MWKYFLRRVLQMIPVVLGTTLLIYALVFALPGDPVVAMFGDKPVFELSTILISPSSFSIYTSSRTP